jgi:addiction module HigA family antidote
MAEDWLARLRQPPPHPGPVFKEFIREEQLEKISQAEAARRLSLTPYHWGQIELGRRPISPAIAVRLEQLTGVSAPFWCRLQMHYDLWHAYQAEKRGELALAGAPFATKLPAPKV